MVDGSDQSQCFGLDLHISLVLLVNGHILEELALVWVELTRIRLLLPLRLVVFVFEAFHIAEELSFKGFGKFGQCHMIVLLLFF